MLTTIDAPAPTQIPPEPRDFLRKLAGPCAIRLAGRERSRCRVLVTLTHGNESSGFLALHRWLQKGRSPLTDILVLLGGVEAALAPPIFYHRHLPGIRDLNRCFQPPYSDSQGKLAQLMIESIEAARPETVVDMHNTSGANKAFAVSCADTPEQQTLAGIFVDTLIVTGLRLGALMEYAFSAPVITVEAGGTQQKGTLDIAFRGLTNYFLAEDLFASPRQVATFHDPLRLELAPDCRMGYAEEFLPDCDVTFRSDLESLNFKTAKTDEPIGWIDPTNPAASACALPRENKPSKNTFAYGRGESTPQDLLPFLWLPRDSTSPLPTASSILSETKRAIFQVRRSDFLPAPSCAQWSPIPGHPSPCRRPGRPVGARLF